ncbi:MAG TPA: hypothetical protein VIP05_21215 [Burkholderiaceae bacterium]
MPAILTSLRADAMRLTHDDVAYEPIVDDASLGALLFALDLLDRAAFDVPAMRYADRVTLGPALEAARQYGLILQRHVDRADRDTPLLPASVKIDHAHAWVHAAAATVPEAERDRFCWRLARRLGQDPWGDGRPAIALANQQFGMFEEGFEEMEARMAAAAASDEAERPGDTSHVADVDGGDAAAGDVTAEAPEAGGEAAASSSGDGETAADSER